MLLRLLYNVFPDPLGILKFKPTNSIVSKRKQNKIYYLLTKNW